MWVTKEFAVMAMHPQQAGKDCIKVKETWIECKDFESPEQGLRGLATSMKQYSIFETF